MNKLLLYLALVGSLVAGPAFMAAGAGTDANNRVLNPGWGPANEVWLTVNPTNPQHLVAVAKDYTVGTLSPCAAYNVWMGIYVSRDGGATWTNKLMPGYPGGPVQNELSQWRCSSDPIAIFGPDGTLYLNGLSIGGSDTGLWVARSHDGGDTFADISIIARSSSLDKNMMNVDPLTGVVYVAWIDFAQGGRIRVAAGVPTPERMTWTAAVNTGGTGSSPMVAPLPGGGVLVGWINGAGGNAIRATTCLPLLLRCDPPVLVASGFSGVYNIPNTAFRAYTLPNAAVDATGVVHMTWHARGATGNSDIFITRSSPNGAAPWSTPSKVNQDSGPADQIMSNVAVTRDGKNVGVLYYDRRDDSANKLITAYVSMSSDGGRTWTDKRVADVPTNGDFGVHQNGFSFIGDYNGIAATDAGVHVAWADSRDYPGVRTGSGVYEAFVSW